MIWACFESLKKKKDGVALGFVMLAGRIRTGDGNGKGSLTCTRRGSFSG